MTTLGTSAHHAGPGDHAEVDVPSRSSRRAGLEGLVLVFGMLGILLGLALTLGSSFRAVQ